MLKIYLQTIGLILDIIGVILLAIGALDKGPTSCDFLEKKGKDFIRTYVLAWIGVAMASLGFLMQILALYIK